MKVKVHTVTFLGILGKTKIILAEMTDNIPKDFFISV